jgi:hypothetical protein
MFEDNAQRGYAAIPDRAGSYDAESTGQPKKRLTTNEKGALGEETAYQRMVERGWTPVGKTDGIYHPGKQGIDGVYKKLIDPADESKGYKYVITEVKYDKSQLSTLEDGTRQMSDTWVKQRLLSKVGPKEYAEIMKAQNNDNLQKILIRVSPDKTVTGKIIGDKRMTEILQAANKDAGASQEDIEKIDIDGYVIRGSKGLIVLSPPTN